MEYEINIERTPAEPEDSGATGKVWIPRKEAEEVPTSLFIYEGGKVFFFPSDVAEQDYPLLMKKMLKAWNGDRPSSKTDENFTLGDA